MRSGEGSALARALRRELRGEVRFDEGSRALYATDASNYRHVPIGVVLPRDVDDAVRALAVCRAHDAPVLARGGGTSLAGQCCNEAVILDFSKYVHRLLALDPRARRARVEPGCILDHLRDAAEEHDLTFGPDPATHDHNTLGGMIGNNSCGVHSVMAGRTVDNVESLDVATYDGLRLRVGATPEEELERIVREGGRRGEIYARLRALRDRYAGLIRERFPDIPRRVSGYSLDQLLPESGFNVARALVGSEGTCVLVCEAELRLVPSPPKRVLAVLGFADIFDAADQVPRLLEFGPVGLEGLDDVLAENLRRKHRHEQEVELLPEGRAWLLAEFGGATRDHAAEQAGAAIEALRASGMLAGALLCGDPHQQHRFWVVRESGLAATAHVPGEAPTWPGWEDAAVRPERLGAYLREFRRLLERHGYRGALYGHFGDGCVHVRIDFDLATEAGIRRYRRFVGEAADLVLAHGGSLSGEHGDGQARGELLGKMYGQELVQAFREFKAIWDPSGRMNPGKVVDAEPVTSSLRLGAGHAPPKLETRFQYPQDRGSFARATLRCVGVGKCRRTHGGVMCPSYMVTREEKHSTRGRARLLFEMLQGQPLAKGWRSEAVREALDLCLACKGCLRDCPVDVDMATYKAEFFAHYYAGRLRPREAWSMGLIYWWCRAAHLAPGLANRMVQMRPVAALARKAGGIHPARRLPRFASETFRGWFAHRPPRALGASPIDEDVVLFPDTFNNYLEPEVAQAATEVLETAGCRVHVPRRPLCCARPLYAWGMIDTAKRLLGQILDTLAPQLEAGMPVVVLEPACAASFRDELPRLLPRDARARSLAERTVLLGEFLARRGRFEPPRLHGRALAHAHCHHHALFDFDTDLALLRGIGLEVERPDSGCCGMAGAFGFEREHYEVSVKAAERVLLPAVRAMDPSALVIADGFSCREQIRQLSDRRPVHLAQVLRDAIRTHAGAGQPRSV